MSINTYYHILKFRHSAIVGTDGLGGGGGGIGEIRYLENWQKEKGRIFLLRKASTSG